MNGDHMGKCTREHTGIARPMMDEQTHGGTHGIPKEGFYRGTMRGKNSIVYRETQGNASLALETQWSTDEEMQERTNRECTV